DHRRAREDEAADGPLGVLDARTALPHRPGDGDNRLVLADDVLVQLVLHAQEALGLVLADLDQRHAGHLADDLVDDLLIDDAVHLLGALPPVLDQVLLLLLQLVRLVTQVGRLLELLLGDSGFLLLMKLLNLRIQLFQVGGSGHGLEADAGARLVDDVNGLVGQAASADVAVGQLDRGLQRLILDLDMVVGLVAVTQATQDLDRLALGGRVDDDLLEASFQGPVLLDVLAVLVQGGGADALDLTPRQRWLEDVGGVDGALGPAGPDQGVQLVDEQDGIAGAADLVHDGLDAFLELSAVLGAGDHHGQIEHDDAAVPQQFGDIAADNHLGESLDDGGLAHAGLAQEHRVVLGAAGQAPDDALDL